MRKSLYLLSLVAIVAAMLALGPQGGLTTSAATPDPAGVSLDSPVKELDKELFVYNWGGYIDETLLKEYEEKYGVKITYDNYATNEELFAKLQGGAEYDIVFPSDYMISRLMELKLIVKIDKANVPNYANIDAGNIDNPYDPGNEYCVPYMWGMTGLAVHRSVKIPDGWGAIFDPEQAKYYAESGGINVLDDSRELIGAALQYLGYSANEKDPEKIKQARDAILKIKDYIKYYNSSDYQDTLLIPKEVVLSHSWNGSTARAAIQTATSDKPKGDWVHVTPKEGGVRFQDGMCVTAVSKRKATAEHFINFLSRPENMARITNEIGYISANRASWSLIDPRYKDFIASEAQTKKLEWLMPLDDATQQIYDEIWTELRAQ